MNKNRWFMSSSGSGDLSLTIKGLLISIAPLIIIVAKATGHEITQPQVDALIALITGGIASAMIVIGFIRKIVNWFAKPFDDDEY